MHCRVRAPPPPSPHAGPRKSRKLLWNYIFIFDTSLCPLRSCKRLGRLFYSFQGSCVKDRFSAFFRGCTSIYKKTLFWVKIASPQKSILTYNKFKNQLTKIALYKVHFIDYYSKVKQTWILPLISQEDLQNIHLTVFCCWYVKTPTFEHAENKINWKISLCSEGNWKDWDKYAK